jgi:acetyl-CoA carboxylase carboxyltransferase component
MHDDLTMQKNDVLAFPLYPSVPIDRGSETYRQNITDWTAVLKQYQEGLQWSASQGTKHYEDRHKERGLLLCNDITDSVLMTARDRVHLLLDPDTPFLELGSFAGYNLDTSSPAASLITGIGVIWCTPRGKKI